MCIYKAYMCMCIVYCGLREKAPWDPSPPPRGVGYPPRKLKQITWDGFPRCISRRGTVRPDFSRMEAMSVAARFITSSVREANDVSGRTSPSSSSFVCAAAEESRESSICCNAGSGNRSSVLTNELRS